MLTLPAFFDVRKHPSWGLAPLIVLVWHSMYTALCMPRDYFFFVCYTANLLLGLGILMRRGMFAGIGFGWMVIATPLWLYDSAIHVDWEPSCAAFHLCGLIVGGITVLRYRLPKHTWIFTLAVGLILQLLARLFTNPVLNVNAAFRIYDGWEFLFSNYQLFFASAVLEFGAVFLLIQYLNNKYVSGEARSQ